MGLFVEMNHRRSYSIGRLSSTISRRKAILTQLSHLDSMGAFESKNLFTVEWVKRISSLSGVSCYDRIVNMLSTYVSCNMIPTYMPTETELQTIIKTCPCNKCDPSKDHSNDYVLTRRIVLKSKRVDLHSLRREAVMKCHREYMSRRYSEQCYSAIEKMVSVLLDAYDMEDEL